MVAMQVIRNSKIPPTINHDVPDPECDLDCAPNTMVERAVDVSEAEEFGAIDLAFRDAGLNMANEVRQASVASRKKRGTLGAV